MKFSFIATLSISSVLVSGCGFLTPPPPTKAKLIVNISSTDSGEPISGAVVSLLHTNSLDEAENANAGRGDFPQSSTTNSSGCALFDMDVLIRPHDFSCLQYQFDSFWVLTVVSGDVQDRFLLEAPNPKVCNTYAFTATRDEFSVIATHGFVIGTYELCNNVGVDGSIVP